MCAVLGTREACTFLHSSRSSGALLSRPQLNRMRRSGQSVTAQAWQLSGHGNSQCSQLLSHRLVQCPIAQHRNVAILAALEA